MARKRKRIKSKNKAVNEGIPLVVLASIGGAVFLGYFAGEIVLFTRPHIYHWLAALIFGLLGYVLGQMYFKRFGDII